MKLIEINKQMAEVIDRLYSLLCKYVPADEIIDAGILREIHEITNARNTVLGEGGGSNDKQN